MTFKAHPNLVLCLALAVAALGTAAHAATPQELAAGYASQAGQPPDPARGQQFFTSRHGKEWSCATCHGTPPSQPGKHAATGKQISTLAPGFNPERFTDPAKVEKWFRRNCKDVLQRECTAQEKGDFIAWLNQIK